MIGKPWRDLPDSNKAKPAFTPICCRCGCALVAIAEQQAGCCSDCKGIHEINMSICCGERDNRTVVDRELSQPEEQSLWKKFK